MFGRPLSFATCSPASLNFKVWRRITTECAVFPHLRRCRRWTLARFRYHNRACLDMHVALARVVEVLARVVEVHSLIAWHLYVVVVVLQE